MLTAFLIMLREGFEAALIVAIIYAYIRKIDRLDLLRPLWLGVIAAVLLSGGIGVGVNVTVESLEGSARLRAFAAISIFAVVVLTWMVFWMRAHARTIRTELEHSITVAVSARGSIRWAIVAAAFFAVARETLEAALFLIAAATTDSGIEVLTGGLLGLGVAGLFGYLVVLGGRRLPMRQFFTITGLMLILFAAGLLSRTIMFLQTAGDVGIAWNNVYDLTEYRWLTVDTEFGKFLGALLGWDPRPSIEQVVAYLGYVITVSYLFLRTGPRPAIQPRTTQSPVMSRQ